MILKKVIWDLMPHGIYNYLMAKRYPDVFTNDYKEYKTAKRVISGFSETPNKTYSSIVSIEGLGYSGSGAVIDFLSEIDSCYVLRNANKKESNKVSHYELDFLRLAGGLFEFEHYLNSNNIFQNDALVNRFVSYLNTFPLFKYDKNIQYLFFDFLSSIVDLDIVDTHGISPNYHLISTNRKTSMFFLRSMTVAQYRSICQRFLIHFFNYINNEHKPTLVMDQLLCDQEFNVSKYKEYLPESKIIVVYRDPRDVYTFAVQHNVEWIAHNDVDSFIKWFKIMIKSFDLQSSDYLVVQFEKFVTEYSNESKRVMDYLGIEEQQHNPDKTRMFFDPDISIKNVGIWKNSSLPKHDYELIFQNLSSYCFNN